MRDRWIAGMLLVAITVGGVLGLGRVGWAETFVEASVEARLVLALHVGQAALQRWVPGPWQVEPLAAGPSKGANLLVIFIDRWLDQDADGKPIPGGAGYQVALAVPATQPQLGESALFVIRIFSGSPLAPPGPYKSTVLATVRREQALKGANADPGLGSEAWEVRDAGGGLMDLRVQYARALPTRAKPEFKLRSPVEPAFTRIYRVDQGTDVVRSLPSAIDRVQSYQLRVTMSELSPLFDGTEQLVSIAVLPWFVRQVYLP